MSSYLSACSATLALAMSCSTPAIAIATFADSRRLEKRRFYERCVIEGERVCDYISALWATPAPRLFLIDVTVAKEISLVITMETTHVVVYMCIDNASL